MARPFGSYDSYQRKISCRCLSCRKCRNREACRVYRANRRAEESERLRDPQTETQGSQTHTGGKP